MAGEQIVRTKKRHQFHAALPAHFGRPERPELDLKPLVVLVNNVEAARKALAAAKTTKGRGRPGSIECLKFLFGGPPPFEAPDAWPQDRVLEWVQTNIEWVQTCAGPNAVVAAAYYYTDERCPYLHLLLIPINDKGRLSWTAVERGFALTPKVPSSLIMSSMQDRYQDEVGKRFGLERGEVGSRRKHEAINQPKGPIDRFIGVLLKRADARRAEAALLHAEDADRERERAVQRQREAEANRDYALDMEASAEAERAGAVKERAQAAARATAAEAESDDLKRSQNSVLRERDPAQKARNAALQELEGERKARTVDTASSKQKLARATLMLQGARARRDQVLREIEDLRKAAPPTQVQIDNALEHARAADEARVGADAERDQATAGRDRARQAYLAEKQHREHVAAKLVQDVAEARQQGYQRGQASRASEIDAAGDRTRNLKIELDALRKRRSSGVQVARREGVAAGRAERDDQITALKQTVKRLTTKREDQVTTLKQTIKRLTTQLTAVNQDRKRLDGNVRNLTEHCDDLKQRLKEPQA